MAPGKATVHDFPATREQVEEMVRRRDPFNSIEAFIDSTDLDSDVKSALWLVAWSEQGHLRRRGTVREVLAAPGAPTP